MTKDEPRLKRIVRKHKIPEYLGIGKTKVDELIAKGEIEVFEIIEGGRAKGALEDNLAAYQQRRLAASKKEA